MIYFLREFALSLLVSVLMVATVLGLAIGVSYLTSKKACATQANDLRADYKFNILGGCRIAYDTEGVPRRFVPIEAYVLAEIKNNNSND